MMTRTFSFLCALLIGLAALPAQTGEWEIFRSPEQVNDYLDMGDYFWLATNNGVSRLQKDDLSSEFWSIENSDLPSGHIQSIAVDQAGTAWIGTYDVEIARWTGDDWEQIALPEELKSDNAQNRLYFLEFDQEDRLWVGTHTGLHRFDGLEWTTWNQSTTGEFIGDVWAIAFGPDGKVYFNSFFIYELDGDQLTDLSQNDFHLLSYGEAYLTMQDNNLWFASPANSLARYSEGEWTIFPLFDSEYWPEVMPSEIRSVAMSPQGEVVVNADPGGLFRLQDNAWMPANDEQSELAELSMEHYFFDAAERAWAFFGTQVSRQDDAELLVAPIAELSIRHNSVRQVVQGGDGSIFALSGKKLVDRYHDGQWEPFWTPADTLSTFSNIQEIEVDPEGHLWITSFAGLFRWDGSAWEQISSGNSDYPFTFAYRLEFGSNGQIWASTNNSVAWFDGQHWTAYTPANSILTDNSFKDMVVDHNGVLWLTNYQRELFRFENGNWQLFTPANSIIPDDYWSGDLEVGPDNRLWISLGYNGLLTIDGADWSIIPIEAIPFDGDLTNAYIYSLHIDDQGLLYLVRNPGLTVWDGAGEWMQFDSENSPLGSYVYSMLSDEEENLWMATNNGLLKYTDVTTTDLVEIDQPASVHLRAFPNPAIDQLTVQWDRPTAAEGTLQIIDGRGRLLQTKAVPAGTQTQQLSVGQFPAGIYYLRWIDGRRQEMWKWVKG